MGFEKIKDSTIGQNVFATMFTLINNNKPNDFTHAGETISWKILSAFPENNAEFPCIIINDALMKPNNPTLDKGNYFHEEIDQEIEFYGLAKWGKERITIGRDSIRNTILTNTSTLDDNKLYLREEPIDDSNVDSFLSGREKINTAATIIRLGKK